MSDPLFRRDERVTLKAAPRVGRAGGACVVVRVMPSEGGARRYVVKSDAERHERVVFEHDLLARHDGGAEALFRPAPKP